MSIESGPVVTAKEGLIPLTISLENPHSTPEGTCRMESAFRRSDQEGPPLSPMILNPRTRRGGLDRGGLIEDPRA